jgi:hypothetical protein
MDIVYYPVDLFRRLGGWNVEVNSDRLLVVTHDDAGKRLVLARIDPWLSLWRRRFRNAPA